MSFLTISCRICYKGNNILKSIINEKWLPTNICNHIQNTLVMTVVSSVMMLTDWLANLAFRGNKMKSKQFWLTKLTLGIAPPSLQCFNRNGHILSILCRGMSDKVWTFLKKSRTSILNIPTKLQLSSVSVEMTFLKTFLSNEFLILCDLWLCQP